MDEKQIENLLELIDYVIRADGSWREKRNAILNVAGEGDKTNLFEFIAWFEDQAAA